MMTTKRELVETILKELQKGQNPMPVPSLDPGGLGLPGTLPIGDGQFLEVTDRLIAAVADFATIVMENEKSFALAYTRKDLRRLMRSAFGQALAIIDLDDPLDQNRDKVLASVSAYLEQQRDSTPTSQEFLFGSWFLGGEQPHAIQIGPVRLADRQSWLALASRAGQISATTRRRLERLWAGGELQPRKRTWDADRESAILDSLGECTATCSVRTVGLVAEAAEQKALLAARLAHTAVALLWTAPSTVLSGLGLLYDGDFHHEHYVSFHDGNAFGASHAISRALGRTPMPADWVEVWNAADWMFNPIGEAISGYVQPEKSLTQPKLLNALFLSLWWFHDACREQSPLMAAVKFAASMDSLAGGRGRKAIVQLIEARRGTDHRGTPILTSGETPDLLIAEIYDYARSRTVHGSNERVGHDWSQTRSRAELLARLCLRMACGWIAAHPDRDDVDGLREV